MTDQERESILETITDSALLKLPDSMTWTLRIEYAEALRADVARSLAASKPPEVVS